MKILRPFYEFYLGWKWVGLMEERKAQYQLKGDYELIDKELQSIESKLGKSSSELYIKWRFYN